jgi:hypothetical protein
MTPMSDAAADNFTEVTKEQFFAATGPLNVHPRVERDACFWELPNRRLIGTTTPGYLSEGERTYRLAKREA